MSAASILRSLALNHFVGTFGFAMSFPFLSIYCHKVLGVSIAETGAWFGILGLIRAASQYASGELSDRIRPGTVMIWSLLGRALSFAFIAAAVEFRAGFYVIIGLTFAGTIAGSLHQIAAQAAVAALFSPADKLRAYAVTRAAANVGFAAGPALGGLLTSTSYVLPFSLTTVFLLASILPVIRLPDTPSPDQTKDHSPVPVRFWLYLTALFLLGCVMSQILTPLSLFITGIKRIPEPMLGLLYTVNGLLVMLLQVYVTRRLATYPHQTVLVAGSLIYFVSYSLMGFGSDYAWFALCMVALTFGEITVSPPALAHAEKSAPPGKAGRYLGLAGVAISLGWFAGPLYGSYLLENLAPAPAWILNAAPALAAAALFLAGRRLDRPGAEAG